MKRLVILLVFAVTQITVSQNYDFGKVSAQELTESVESDKDAVILYKKRKTNFEYNAEDGWIVVTNIHQRIKINTKDGLDWGTHSRMLYVSGGNKEDMKSIKGFTYNLVGGKVEKAKLKNNAIFREEASRYRNKVSFTMPNVKEGSIVEFEYTIKSPFYDVRNLVVQHSIPVIKYEGRVDIPEYFRFNQFQKGYYQVKFTRESERRKIMVRWREAVDIKNAARTESRSGSLDFLENRYFVTAVNVPALEEEDYVNNMNNYRTSFVFELAQYRPPNGTFKNFALNWEDVVETIYKSDSFGGELKKTAYFENDIKELTGSVSDPMTRMALIYDFVKERVKWNGYYGKYTDDGVKKAYKEKVGNAAEINLMLTAMLRSVGLNANPVLVSTRNNGVPLFPTLEGYNYVVASVEVLNDVILLDATNQYGIPNVLPYRTLNWEGRIVRENGSTAQIDLYPKKASQNTISMMVKLGAEGDIEGSRRTVKTNHNAMFYRERYIAADKDKFLEDLENDFDGIEVYDFEVKNEEDLSKPVMETYKFNMEGQSDIVGDKMYFTPLLFLAETENPFKLEEREFPVDFGYPSATKYRVNITLPEGYEVESIPESVAFALPDNLGKFKYVIHSNGKSLQIALDSQINEAIISPTYYETLKAYYNQVIEKQKEQIVLKKVAP